MPMMQQIWKEMRPQFLSTLLKTHESGASHKTLMALECRDIRICFEGASHVRKSDNFV
jgi:hypothetical protein